MSKSKDVSIIIPAYNYTYTKGTIDSLSKQIYPGKKEIILIYDNPKVPLGPSFKKFLRKYNIKLIENKTNLGLAGNYNLGIKKSKFSNIMTIHEDCVPRDRFLIRNIINKLNSREDIFVVNAKIVTQRLWDSYEFWNKILNFRHLDIVGAMGKATAFKKEIFRKIGLFDSKIFRTAGEDMDFNYRLENKNINTEEIEDIVYHIHRQKKANLITVLKKEWQFGEAHGAFKRKYNLKRLGYFDVEFRVLFLIISLTGLLINNYLIVIGLLPFVAIPVIHAISNFKKTKWLTGLFLYPFIGILVMLTQTIAAVKSFITGKQTI